MTAEVVVAVEVDAPPEVVWDAVTDWPRQSQWMLGTTVRATTAGGVGLGGGIEAYTGIGRVGFLDPMVITEWDPPRRCVVRHTGRVVRGDGVFEVLALPLGRSRFVWSEVLQIPGGWLGRLGWPVVAPAFVLGVRRSLQSLADDVGREHANSHGR
ncbi:MAG: SRPBCC family protein [Actinomycetes bacterium]